MTGPTEVASLVTRHCVLVALAPPQMDTIGTHGDPSYAAADIDALAQDMGTVRCDRAVACQDRGENADLAPAPRASPLWGGAALIAAGPVQESAPVTDCAALYQ